MCGWLHRSSSSMHTNKCVGQRMTMGVHLTYLVDSVLYWLRAHWLTRVAGQWAWGSVCLFPPSQQRDYKSRFTLFPDFTWVLRIQIQILSVARQVFSWLSNLLALQHDMYIVMYRCVSSYLFITTLGHMRPVGHRLDTSVLEYFLIGNF